MPNPLFNALGGNAAMQGKMGNFGQMLRQYQKFRREFQGDPRQEVQKMLQSGKISQQQLDQAQAVAQQFSGLFGDSTRAHG